MPIPIPPNNASHPRWLLDLEDWKVVDYRDIEDIEEVGYGIISYTWGRWGDWDTVPKNLPAGIDWKVPNMENMETKTGFTLDHARKVVGKMKIRYVWWDWFCVPQVKGGPLLQAKGEEVAKQLTIYKKAKESIVWIHGTTWGEKSPLERLILNELPDTKDVRKYMDGVITLIDDARKGAPWLSSGWTLQEGIMLTYTRLLDRNGDTLKDKRCHRKGEATVLDLTEELTGLSDDVGLALRNAHEPDYKDDSNKILQFVRESQENYDFAAQFLSRLVRTGLVYYASFSMLYVLAGKCSRHYSTPEDQCWALIGALDLEGITPRYDHGKFMEYVKAFFFNALLDRYQWFIMLVPGPSADNQKLDTYSWEVKITDGKLLPLASFFGMYFEEDLPKLEWFPRKSGKPDYIQITPWPEKDEKTGKPIPGKPFTFLKASGKGKIFCRRYEQADKGDGEGFIRVLPVQPLDTPSSLFFSFWQLEEKRDGMEGIRCMEIAPDASNPGSGRFKGIIELWMSEDDVFEKIELEEYRLPGSAICP